ncbi:MAG: hypothetical protein H7328_04775 [Bdellovibrio sp.]|nr:hypothetical protein [Bdellovibrio sp.]
MAQTDTTSLPEKYNGFGLPNTKFKKVQITNEPKEIETKAATAKPVEIKKVNSILKPSLQSAEKQAEKSVKLGFDISASYNLQSEKQLDGSQYRYLYYEANPKIQFSEYTIAGSLYFYQNTDKAGDNEWDDSTVAISHKAWNTGNYFTLMPVLIYGFPLSTKSREFAKIKSTAGASLVLGLNMANLGVPQVILNYSLNYTKIFTDSDFNSKNEPTSNYRLRQRLNFGYSITEKFSFKTRFQFDSLFAKDDFVTNAFLHYEQLDYSINDYLQVFIGHTNSNGLFNPETYQNNLKLFDSNTSEYYIGFGLSFKNY